MPKQTIQEPPNRDPGTSGLRPGDDLNARGDWANVLESHGWRLVFQRDGVGYWRRPGKNGGVSATTNYQGSDLLYVFSSSTPFETERGYSKFSAYALLEHNNDYAAAARALVGMGYGDPQTGANGHHTNGRQEVPEHDIAQAGGHQPAESDTPILPADVWTGWLSAYRDWVLPTTDGSIEGMFGAASVQLGIAIGRNVSIHYGVPTFANLFVALCGPTGVPRKTTLINRTQSVQDWAFTGDFLRVVRSIGSGEGLLERFCQEIEEGEGKNKRTVLAPIPGQRVLLDEPELTNLLKKMRRPGTANIAEILLGLFDGVDYSPNTRRRPIVVQEPFFSIITATTPEALESTLNDVDIDSGLIPRVATFWCTPREPIAYPPAPDQAQLSALASTLQDVARFAEQLHQHDPNLQLSQDARHEWETIYRDLVKETRAAPKAVAGIMARVPTMVMKWALLYAVQGFHAIIEVDDLARAVMVGDYLMKTARLVPQHVEKIPIARIENRILDGMAKAPEKWWRPKDIDQKVGGRISAPELRRSLESLAALGKLDIADAPSGRTQLYRLSEG
jgi:hypothetical protein